MPLPSRKQDSPSKRLHRKLEQLLWHKPLEELAFPKRQLVRSAQILFAILRDLAEGQISLRAMSLVYSTILGFVPMVALTFAVLKSFGIHNAMEPFLFTLLEALGDRREDVIAEIIGFVDNIRVDIIGITSLGLLIYLVLDMMRKIETSFNYIWCISTERSWSSRVSEYLFAVIVSPLLLFISISLTSSVNTNFFSSFVENLAFGSTLVEFFAFIIPLLFMSLAFAFAYSFLPNTRVNFSSAFVGGIITTIVWKMMGAFFQGFFIAAARESIYLAFATVIVVMILTYIGWLVALLGGDIAYYHQNPNKTRTGRKPVNLSIAEQEYLVLSMAALIINRFERKLPALNEAELAQRLGINSLTAEATLEKLVATGLLVNTNDDPVRFVPAISVRDCKMVDIWRAIRQGSSPLKLNDKRPELLAVNEFISRLDASVIQLLGQQTFSNDDVAKSTESD
jgi:membrane protein